jgi:hypothetical protein
MKTLLLPLFFLFFLTSVVFAETETTQNQLIAVGGDLVFSNLLPGYDYSREIVVGWNVPDSALKGISAKEVFVQVDVSSSKPDSPMLFSIGETPYKTLSFALKCVVKNDSCDKDASQLTKVFTALVSVPAISVTPYSDSIVLQAKLSSADAGAIPSATPTPLPSATPSPSVLPSVSSSQPTEPSASPQVQSTTGLFGVNSGTLNLGIAAIVLLAIGIVLDKFAK